MAKRVAIDHIDCRYQDALIQHAIAVARELAPSKLVLECDDDDARDELRAAIEARNIPDTQVDDVVALTFAFAHGRGSETPDALIRCVDLDALAADGEICAADIETINGCIDEATIVHPELGNTLAAQPAIAKALALAEAECLAKYHRDLARAVEALIALQLNGEPVDAGHAAERQDSKASAVHVRQSSVSLKRTSADRANRAA